MCLEIIRNNSLVGGRTPAESNPHHWVRHALLHMVAKCINHSATRAGLIPAIPNDILLEQVEEEDRSWPGWPMLTWKHDC